MKKKFKIFFFALIAISLWLGCGQFLGTYNSFMMMLFLLLTFGYLFFGMRGDSELMSLTDRMKIASVMGIIFLLIYFDGATENVPSVKIVEYISLFLFVIFLCPFIPIRLLFRKNTKELSQKQRKNGIVLGVFILGLSLISLIVPAKRFMCNKDIDTCEFQYKHLWEINFYPHRIIRISNIKDISISHVLSVAGRRHPCYYVDIKTKEGVFHLFTSMTERITPEARVLKIQKFLTDKNQRQLKIQEPQLSIAYAFIFFIIGCWILKRFKKNY